MDDIIKLANQCPCEYQPIMHCNGSNVEALALAAKVREAGYPFLANSILADCVWASRISVLEDEDDLRDLELQAQSSSYILSEQSAALPKACDGYENRITCIVMAKTGEPTFSYMSTKIEITDEAGGEYVQVTQQMEKPGVQQQIEIDPTEWQTLKNSIDFMIRNCRNYD